MWNKNIFQTYECDFEELHESFKKCCNLWKNTYPDWKYCFKNPKERREEVINILCLSPIEAEIYDNYSGMTQSDIWRYSVTCFYGGMYADLDSIPIINIEPILHELNDTIEMVALPNGDQINGLPGSNNCNFILKLHSEIGLSLLADVKKHFEENEERLKNNAKPKKTPTHHLFRKTVASNRSKVAQIFDQRYVTHSRDYKPDTDYRLRNEKQMNHSYFVEEYCDCLWCRQ
jgi:hypothetical protein